MRKFDGYLRGVNLGGWLSQCVAYTEEHFNGFITEEDIKKIEIPEGVVDVKAYKQYYALSQHPIFGQSRYIETSDGGEVNLGAMTGNFRRYIAHLSPKEQEELMEMCKDILAKAEAKGRMGRPVRAMVVGVMVLPPCV